MDGIRVYLLGGIRSGAFMGLLSSFLLVLPPSKGSHRAEKSIPESLIWLVADLFLHWLLTRRFRFSHVDMALSIGLFII